MLRRSTLISGYRAHITAGNFSVMLLRLCYAAFLLIIGIDKILHTDMIATWAQFIGPVMHALLPLPVVTEVSIEGLIEIALGILLLTTWIRIGSVILLLFTLLLCADLFILHYFDLALRDLLFCTGVIVLISHYNRLYQAKFAVTPFSDVAPVT